MKKLLFSLGLLSVLSVMQNYGAEATREHIRKQRDLQQRISKSKSDGERRELQTLLDADLAIERAEIDAMVAESNRLAAQPSFARPDDE
ncbi:MAG TPA: hypothetical protein VJJ83_01050 [Candidatus Babeliales bacterium]|nr:hypothetical protein [Candidatus Babeliales bacterium]